MESILCTSGVLMNVFRSGLRVAISVLALLTSGRGRGL